MNRFRWGALLTAILPAAGVWWAWAQPAPQPLEALVPAGALVYLEARDFGALVRDWDGSAEKTAWLASSNYAVFSRSHLLLRFADAQTEFAAAAGLPPDYALLNAVAGSNSAFALYDIGKLEFLYLTHLPSARALGTALWRSRGTYQTRRAGGVDYYVKVDRASQRSTAFAYTGDLLLLATRESALAGALELLARQSRPSLAAEPWFAQATGAAQPGARDLRMAYNLERLTATPYFRSYWIQQNGAALKEFGTGLADLERTPGELRERRVLLRSATAPDLSADEGAAGEALALVPDSASLYRAWARPTPAQAKRWTVEKLFGTSSGGAARSLEAPELPESAALGEEADLEVRIDETPAMDDRASSAFRPLRDLLAAPLRAMVEISATRLDAGQVFVRPHSALVLLGERPWHADAVRAAISQAAGTLWTQSGLGTQWTAAPTGQQLDGLGRIVVAVDGNRLVVGDSPELVAAIWARRDQPAGPGAIYAAGWRHARELPNFERMMRLIDYPEIRAQDPGNGARAPMFYSENLASFGRVLGRIEQAAIATHDTGGAVRETMIYRLTP